MIPRPETEHLVELIINHYNKKDPNFHILDVGCGTGVIGLALLSAWPQSTCTSIDSNPLAQQVTNENALLLGLQNRLTTLCTSVQDYIPSTRIDMIISNPPYIPSKDMQYLNLTVSVIMVHFYY